MGAWLYSFLAGLALFGIIWLVCQMIGGALIEYMVLSKRLNASEITLLFEQFTFPFDRWYVNPKTHGFRTRLEYGKPIDPITRLLHKSWSILIFESTILILLAVPFGGFAFYALVVLAWQNRLVPLIFWTIIAVILMGKTLLLLIQIFAFVRVLDRTRKKTRKL